MTKLENLTRHEKELYLEIKRICEDKETDEVYLQRQLFSYRELLLETFEQIIKDRIVIKNFLDGEE